MTTIVVNDQPFEDLFGAGHDENTFIIKLRGQTAFRAYHNSIATLMTGHFGFKNDEILQIYRFERPGEWFVKLSPGAVARKNIHGLSFATDQYEGDICDTAQQTKTTFVHWAPPAMKAKTIRTLAGKFLQKDFILSKPRGATDRWVLVHDQNERIPHYMELNAKGPEGQIRKHVLMMTQAGRRQACRHCSSVEHWTTACPTKTSRPSQEIIEKPAEQDPTESPDDDTPTKQTETTPTEEATAEPIQMAETTPTDTDDDNRPYEKVKKKKRTRRRSLPSPTLSPRPKRRAHSDDEATPAQEEGGTSARTAGSSPLKKRVYLLPPPDIPPPSDPTTEDEQNA